MTPIILEVTPFGFVMELPGGCHYADAPYDMYVDDELVKSARENVVALFGLMPDRKYKVELRGLSDNVRFEVHTQPLKWLIDVRQYGAKGDGQSDDTAAIAAAIYTAPEGATVRFPKGEYVTSQVLLRSGVDIYLMDGATIRQSTDRSRLAVLKGFQWDYTHEDFTVNSSWEGNPLDCYLSLIYGKNVQNVRIYGTGIIDGSGKESGFWLNPKGKDVAYRPRNLSLYGCEHITVMGITSRNSACWNVHPHRSDNLRFVALTIESDPSSPNTDGLNPESCRDVLISGCRFLVGDDCIAIKSGKPFMARMNHRPTERVEIRNCLMRDGHGAVVIGSEIASGACDVRVSRCRFERTDRGLRIKTRRGRGALSVVDGVTIEDCEMVSVRHCLVVNMFYNCDPDGHSEYVSSKAVRAAGEDTPSVRNIVMRRVKATGITGSGAFVYGLPESPVTGVVFEGCEHTFREERVVECPAMMDGFVMDDAIDAFFENVENAEEVRMQWKG